MKENLKSKNLYISKIQQIIKTLFVGIFGVFITFFILIYTYSFFITPFTSTDLSVDLGILILKDGFVKFVWIILEIGILLFVLNFLFTKIKEFKKNGIKNWITSTFIKKQKRDKRLLNTKIENDISQIEVFDVKDFMQTEGYTSVHKTVRANSQNFLYITFIKLDNSALNIYLSKKASKSFHNGQEIKKGFFSTLLVAKSNDKIRLVEKNHQSECDFPF